MFMSMNESVWADAVTFNKRKGSNKEWNDIIIGSFMVEFWKEDEKQFMTLQIGVPPTS